MIIEIVFKEQPTLELAGYEETKLPTGVIFSSPIEKRVEVVVKKHPDGRVSVFTDKLEVIKSVVQSAGVVDIHVK